METGCGALQKSNVLPSNFSKVMKKLSHISSAGIFILVLAINSCHTSSTDLSPHVNIGSNRVGDSIAMGRELEDPTLQTDVEVRDGILHFKNLIVFLTLESKLRAALNDDQKKSLLNAPGFESLSQAVNKALGVLGDSTKSASVDEVLANNSDILKKRNGILVLKGSRLHSDLINREGLMYIGKVLYRFTDSKVIIVSDGDLTKARQADQPAYKSINVAVFSNGQQTGSSPNGRTASTCTDVFGESWSSDGYRYIQYAIDFYIDSYLSSGTAGTASARYYNSHLVSSIGVPYTISPAFSHNFTAYSTDNHFFLNILAHYHGYYTGFTDATYTASSYTEQTNHSTQLAFNYNLYTTWSLTESQNNSATSYSSNYVYFEGGISAFGSNTSQYGYYYSTGVPTPIYMACP